MVKYNKLGLNSDLVSFLSHNQSWNRSNVSITIQILKVIKEKLDQAINFVMLGNFAVANRKHVTNLNMASCSNFNGIRS